MQINSSPNESNEMDIYVCVQKTAPTVSKHGADTILAVVVCGAVLRRFKIFLDRAAGALSLVCLSRPTVRHTHRRSDDSLLSVFCSGNYRTIDSYIRTVLYSSYVVELQKVRDAKANDDSLFSRIHLSLPTVW